VTLAPPSPCPDRPGESGFTLLEIMVGLLVSVLVWVFSSRAQNYHHATLGRQGTIIAFLGALIAGAAPALINFFQGLGSQVK